MDGLISQKLFRGARLAVAVVGPLAGLACGGRAPGPGGGGTPQPATAEETLSEIFNLTGLYQRLGRIAAGPPVPFVGQFTFFAGRGDSSVVLLALSLDNRAIAFERSNRDFQARYRVEMSFQHAGELPLRFAREETVTVASFQETQRVDETVVFQQAFLLPAGDYQVSVTVRDPRSGSFSRGEMAVAVPTFGPGTFSAPILVYRPAARFSLWEEPAVVVNPRGMVAHGDDSLVVFVEAYELAGPRALPVTVRDESGRVVLSDSLRFQGGRAVEAANARLPAEGPSLGKLTVTVGEGSERKEAIALVSFSRSWVLTNYDNLLSLLRFFGHESEVDALRRASPEDRPALWRRFWEETDPQPNTPENEALDQYFTRVAIANERFRDEGGANGGWRTERGEVFVTLGEPDQMYESPPGYDTRILQWVYNDYRAVLTFTGQIGFARMRLTSESRAEFARVRALVRQRQRNPSD